MAPESPEELIFGRHPVLEALEAGVAIDRVLVAEGAHRRGSLSEILGAAHAKGVRVQWVPRAALDRLVGGAARHQGVVAYGGYRYADVAEILAHAIRAGEPPFILALDALQDVHNVGSLLRSAEAVGVHGVILSERQGTGVTGAVRKSSAGAVEHLAVARTDLPAALDELQRRGVTVVGLDMSGAVTYDQADLRVPLVLAVGGEERGLLAAVRRRCDVLVGLPMRGRVASLNAAVAGSIVLYEALRQRGGAQMRPPAAAPGFDRPGGGG